MKVNNVFQSFGIGRLMSAGILSAVVAIMVTGYLTYGKYRYAQDMTLLERLVVLLPSTSNLMYDLQKERDFSVAYQGDRDGFYQKLMVMQYQVTDGSYRELKDVESRYEFADRPHYQNIIRETIRYMGDLKALRKNIAANKLTEEEIVEGYDRNLQQLRDFVPRLLGQTTDQELFQSLTAYKALQTIKNMVARERVMGTIMFNRREITADAFQRFTEAVVGQNDHLKIFIEKASLNMVAQFTLLADKKADRYIEKFRRDLLSGVTTVKLDKVSQQMWFSHISQKINQLKKQDFFMASAIVSEADKATIEANRQFVSHMILFSVLLCLLGVLIMTNRLINLPPIFSRF